MNSEIVILYKDYTQKFYSTISVYPIISYTLVDQNGSPYTGSDVYFDINQNILINTSELKQVSLFLQAASDNSTQNGLLPLYLSVNNFAPIFEEGPPETELAQFNV